jgi:hypothetical protein
VISYFGFHRWRATQGLMDSTKIVVHEMERNSRFVILNLLAEAVSQSGKAAND